MRFHAFCLRFDEIQLEILALEIWLQDSYFLYNEAPKTIVKAMRPSGISHMFFLNCV